MTTSPGASDALEDFADLLRGTDRADPAPVDPGARRRRRRRASIITAAVLAVVLGVPGGYAAWALNAPVSAAVADIAQPGTRAEPAVVLPLPADGAAAISVAGADAYLGEGAAGIWASSGGDDPRPIASITKLITAMVVLDAHPLADAADPGPTLTFGRADHALYDKYYVMDATIAAMPTGSSMSLRDALATMLIPSASNYAEAVARWAFGSVGGFTAAADRWLDAHGMPRTTIVEPTGIDPRNVSAPSDLIVLGRLAAAHPVVAEIVGTRSLTLEVPGEMINTNKLLGDRGVTGLKTGTLADAGSNLLYSASLEVGLGEPLQVVGVVLGGFSQSTVNNGVRDLLGAVAGGFARVTVAEVGQRLGTYSTAWGSTAELVVAESAAIRVWSDTEISAALDVDTPTTWRDGEVVGEMTWTAGPETVSVAVRLSGEIEPPTAWWRLTHPGELG